MYPAISVLRATAGAGPDRAGDESDRDVQRAQTVDSELPVQADVLWVGSVGGMEVDLVKRTGIPFEAIPAAGVHGVGLRALPRNLLQLWRGYWQARRILRAYRPDVLFFTGGFVAVPMALAGHRIPSALYVPDIEPGLALKFLARFADRIAVTAEDSRAFFARHKGVAVTGYPVRANLKTWSLPAAREALGLLGDLPTLLVFGGSKGARSINRALLAVLPELLGEMQVVHISGRLDWPEVEAAREALRAEKGLEAPLVERYRAFPYLHDEMGAALTAADLVVSRAGAATLGEYPQFGLPAVLVPYPHAWRYQRVNAEYLARHGAALILEDAELHARLLPIVQELMRDQAKREQMREAARLLAQPVAARSIFSLLQSLAANRGP